MCKDSPPSDALQGFGRLGGLGEVDARALWTRQNMPPEAFHQVLSKPLTCHRKPSTRYYQNPKHATRNLPPGITETCRLYSRPILGTHRQSASRGKCCMLQYRPCLSLLVRVFDVAFLQHFAGTHAHSWQHQPTSGCVPFLLPLKSFLTLLQRVNQSQGLLQICLLGFPMNSLLHRQSAGVILNRAVFCVYMWRATVWSFSCIFVFAVAEQSYVLSSGVEPE